MRTVFENFFVPNELKFVLLILIGESPCYKLSQTSYLKKSMPYHLLIYHNTRYPIASQFSCFMHTLKSLKLTNKLQFIYEFCAEDNLLPFICKFQATERGRILVIFQICQAVQRERHICMPISAPHIALTSETLPLIFKKNKSIHANETITQNRTLTGEIHHGNEISICADFSFGSLRSLKRKVFPKSLILKNFLLLRMLQVEKLFHNEKCFLKCLFYFSFLP